MTTAGSGNATVQFKLGHAKECDLPAGRLGTLIRQVIGQKEMLEKNDH